MTRRTLQCSGSSEKICLATVWSGGNLYYYIYTKFVHISSPKPKYYLSVLVTNKVDSDVCAVPQKFITNAYFLRAPTPKTGQMRVTRSASDLTGERPQQTLKLLLIGHRSLAGLWRHSAFQFEVQPGLPHVLMRVVLLWRLTSTWPRLITSTICGAYSRIPWHPQSRVYCQSEWSVPDGFRWGQRVTMNYSVDLTCECAPINRQPGCPGRHN